MKKALTLARRILMTIVTVWVAWLMFCCYKSHTVVVKIHTADYHNQKLMDKLKEENLYWLDLGLLNLVHL